MLKSSYASVYLEECSSDWQGSRCERRQIKSHTALHFCCLDSTAKWSHFGDPFSQLLNTNFSMEGKNAKSTADVEFSVLSHEICIGNLVLYTTTAFPLPQFPFPLSGGATVLSYFQQILRKKAM